MAKNVATKIVLKISGSMINVFFNIAFYVAAVLLTIQLCKMAFAFSYEMFGSVPRDEKPGFDVPFQIMPGESRYTIAQKLETREIIVNKYSFYLKTILMNPVIMPGTFMLNTSMDYDEIIEVIIKEANSIE